MTNEEKEKILDNLQVTPLAVIQGKQALYLCSSERGGYADLYESVCHFCGKAIFHSVQVPENFTKICPQCAVPYLKRPGASYHVTPETVLEIWRRFRTSHNN